MCQDPARERCRSRAAIRHGDGEVATEGIGAVEAQPGGDACAAFQAPPSEPSDIHVTVLISGRGRREGRRYRQFLSSNP